MWPMAYAMAPLKAFASEEAAMMMAIRAPRSEERYQYVKENTIHPPS
jgi:hypothetical protein